MHIQVSAQMPPSQGEFPEHHVLRELSFLPTVSLYLVILFYFFHRLTIISTYSECSVIICLSLTPLPKFCPRKADCGLSYFPVCPRRLRSEPHQQLWADWVHRLITSQAH